MAFRIDATNGPENRVDFEIHTNDGATHNITLLKNDCLPPDTVGKLNEFFKSIEDTDLMPEVNRGQLKIICPGHDDVFDQLTERQITNLLNHYREESKGDEGETVASGS